MDKAIYSVREYNSGFCETINKNNIFIKSVIRKYYDSSI